MELIFATNNRHKVEEMQAAIGDKIKLVTLKEAGIHIDIPEPHDTIEANASEKSRTIFELTGRNCFSEDTGLEVNALNGEPGVKSARYAGDNANADMNIDKLLSALDNRADRTAQFKTVISLILEGKEFLFEGICKGTIRTVRSGSGGFGYDPVFEPDGGDRTFGEMNMDEKAIFSHRKKAADRLVLFLQNIAEQGR